MRHFTVRFALVLPLLAAIAGCSGTINDFPTTPTPVIVTDTFTGNLNINGGATHNVFTGATGTVVATLTSLGENPPSKVGFSIGTLGASGNCSAVITKDDAVLTTVITGSVTSLTGSLCVRIYDVGALTETIAYTFTVSHP
jgi:hypothetical protein